jgi:thymidylate kinase
MSATPALSARPHALGVIADLVTRLHEEAVPYCVWKGSVRLRAALSGEKDLDLLVHEQSARRLAGILRDVGFKRFPSASGRGVPGVEDHFAVDAPTGTLVHLHLHFMLVPTRTNPLGYRMPWERTVLRSRVLAEGHDVYVASPHVELVLFLVREALAAGTRELSLGKASRAPCFEGARLAEFRWLVAQVREQRLFEVARDLLGDEVACLMTAMLGGSPSTGQLAVLCARVEPRLRAYRVRGAFEALRRRVLQWWRLAYAALGLRAPSLAGRTPPGGGLVVTLVGPDGSGKSTLVRELTRWLAPKVRVVSVYMGSGSGRASLPRRFLRLIESIAGSLLRAQRGRRAPALDAPEAPAGSELRRRQAPGRAAVLWRILKGLALAREQRARLARVEQARRRGAVVICDRFPQAQVMGVSDGPLLSEWLDDRSWLRRTAARAELAAYQAATAVPPDLVVKLHVAPDVAWHRKRDMSLDALCRRVQAVRALHFPGPTRVVDLDAERPFAEVLLDVKQAIWSCL